MQHGNGSELVTHPLVHSVTPPPARGLSQRRANYCGAAACLFPSQSNSVKILHVCGTAARSSASSSASFSRISSSVSAVASLKILDNVGQVYKQRASLPASLKRPEACAALNSLTVAERRRFDDTMWASLSADDRGGQRHQMMRCSNFVASRPRASRPRRATTSIP